jgi:hypothetical protein
MQLGIADPMTVPSLPHRPDPNQPGGAIPGFHLYLAYVASGDPAPVSSRSLYVLKTLGTIN